MSVPRIAVSLAVVALSGAALSAAAANGCKLEREASLPAHLAADDRLVVDARVEGRPVAFLFSPALAYSALTSATAEQASSPIFEQRRRSAFHDGTKLTRETMVSNLDIGNMSYVNQYMPVLESGAVPDGIGGIVGANLLRHDDIEVDLTGGMVSIYAPSRCGQTPVYWAKDWFELPVRATGEGDRLIASITANGKPLQAMIDFGAGRSVLTPAAAASVLGSSSTTKGDIGSLAIGSITFHAVSVDVRPFAPADIAPGEAAPAADMLIGMHEFKRLRTYVDYTDGKLAFTLAGNEAAAGR
ncbi:MAG TPA: pepsin/retropepsin-like aspartic protease family protein [Stellaceae bacterium]|nr:pepsin/retropepsin-like aspartic protease family protein [Stellaceae bacterium]